MSKNESIEKRRGGSALLIIILIVVLSLLFFVFLTKQFDIKLVDRVSASIEKGMAYSENIKETEPAPTVNPRHVSIVYVTKDNRISSCFVQVINALEKNIFYVEIPLNSKLTISTELYKELLTYAPTLPQYVKLSRSYNYFSENYRYEGCTKIISENIGVKVTDWCVMAEEDFKIFMEKSTTDEYSKEDFYSIYKEYADSYRNSMSSKTRWAYYEIFDKSTFVDKGAIPGQWDKTDFNITLVQARELIEELKY